MRTLPTRMLHLLNPFVPLFSADIAHQIATFKGEANAWLSDPNYNTLRLRLEIAHAAVEAAAVEARRRVRLNEGHPR